MLVEASAPPLAACHTAQPAPPELIREPPLMQAALRNSNTVLQAACPMVSKELLVSAESLFEDRGKRGSYHVNMLLTELEKHDGICILATNRSTQAPVNYMVPCTCSALPSVSGLSRHLAFRSCMHLVVGPTLASLCCQPAARCYPLHQLPAAWLGTQTPGRLGQ